MDIIGTWLMNHERVFKQILNMYIIRYIEKHNTEK